MTPAIASRLIRLYPAGWRARYGDELAALLEEYPPSLLSVWDVLLGALDARIAPLDTNGRILHMLNQSRRSVITVFCAYIAFVLVGASFNQMIEDDLKTLNGAHPSLAAAYYVVFASALVSLLAVLAGGLPIAFAVVRRALAEGRRDIPLLFAVPPIALAIWLGWTWITLNVIAPANVGAAARNTPVHIVFVLWVAVLALAALASTAAVSVAVARCDVSPRLYRLALPPALITTLAMAVTLGGVVAWGLLAHAELSAYLDQGTTPFHVAIAPVLIAHIVIMALATLIAALAVIRAFRSPGGEAIAAQAPRAA